MRKEKSETSEMVNQVLFGEHFKILKKVKKWSFVELFHDNYKGWICNKQYSLISKRDIPSLICNKKHCHIKIDNNNQSIILGSLIPKDEEIKETLKIKSNLNFLKMQKIDIWFNKMCKKYLNTPYLWGGRTPFGIDCSGYTQMVFRFFDIYLPRDSCQQEKEGDNINFSKRKMGDLAFFEVKNKITHVGIILKKNKIIHSSGKVKINYIDNLGIYENPKLKEYTHKLKSIKRLI